MRGEVLAVAHAGVNVLGMAGCQCFPHRAVADEEQLGARLLDVYQGDVTFTLVKGADHRLSEPAHIRLLETTLATVLKDLSC